MGFREKGRNISSAPSPGRVGVLAKGHLLLIIRWVMDVAPRFLEPGLVAAECSREPWAFPRAALILPQEVTTGLVFICTCLCLL